MACIDRTTLRGYGLIQRITILLAQRLVTLSQVRCIVKGVMIDTVPINYQQVKEDKVSYTRVKTSQLDGFFAFVHVLSRTFALQSSEEG